MARLVQRTRLAARREGLLERARPKPQEEDRGVAELALPKPGVKNWGAAELAEPELREEERGVAN